MAIKQKPVYVCDYCGKEVDENTMVRTTDLSNEGCSKIIYRGHAFAVVNGYYCDLYCLIAHIRSELES